MHLLDNYYGFSSLLFIISTTKAFSVSEYIVWKWSNAFLIVASYLCNYYKFADQFLFLDYLSISVVCASYVNDPIISLALLVGGSYEYYKSQDIVYCKNIAFILAVSKSILYTFLFVDNTHCYIVLSSSIGSVLVFHIRSHLFFANNQSIEHKYHIFLTWVLHFCIMNIMYISSITAKPIDIAILEYYTDRKEK